MTFRMRGMGLFCLGFACFGACDEGGAPADGGAADGGGGQGDGGGGSGGGGDAGGDAGKPGGDGGAGQGDAGSGGGGGSDPGTPTGPCSPPGDAQLESVSSPTTVVGTGTPASCTSSAFVAAVAKGGVITFNCGPSAHTIRLDATAKVVNTSSKVVIDGGGKITLSGGGQRRILYQNTCDEAQMFTTSHCDNQETPQLTVQNLTFEDGNAKNEKEGSGGAIYAQGGRLKVIKSRFFDNVCKDTGPDVGGGAIRALQQYNGQPVYVVESLFGGTEGRGNVCANGGALSSIGVSWTISNSAFSYNAAIGRGANPPQPSTPGGGSGGAIYNDGNAFTLNLCGVTMEHNDANEGGGGIFFVSNNRTGTLRIEKSTLRDNVSGKFETAGYPGIFVLSTNGDKPTVVDSTITK